MTDCNGFDVTFSPQKCLSQTFSPNFPPQFVYFIFYLFIYLFLNEIKNKKKSSLQITNNLWLIFKIYTQWKDTKQTTEHLLWKSN